MDRGEGGIWALAEDRRINIRSLVWGAFPLIRGRKALDCGKRGSGQTQTGEKKGLET